MACDRNQGTKLYHNLQSKWTADLKQWNGFAANVDAVKEGLSTSKAEVCQQILGDVHEALTSTMTLLKDIKAEAAERDRARAKVKGLRRELSSQTSKHEQALSTIQTEKTEGILGPVFRELSHLQREYESLQGACRNLEISSSESEAMVQQCNDELESERSERNAIVRLAREAFQLELANNAQADLVEQDARRARECKDFQNRCLSQLKIYKRAQCDDMERHLTRELRAEFANELASAVDVLHDQLRKQYSGSIKQAQAKESKHKVQMANAQTELDTLRPLQAKTRTLERENASLLGEAKDMTAELERLKESVAELQKERDHALAKAKSLEDVASATDMECAPTSSVPAIEAPAADPKNPEARDYISNQVIQLKVSQGQGLWSPPTGLRNPNFPPGESVRVFKRKAGNSRPVSLKRQRTEPSDVALLLDREQSPVIDKRPIVDEHHDGAKASGMESRRAGSAAHAELASVSLHRETSADSGLYQLLTGFSQDPEELEGGSVDVDDDRIPSEDPVAVDVSDNEQDPAGAQSSLEDSQIAPVTLRAQEIRPMFYLGWNASALEELEFFRALERQFIFGKSVSSLMEQIDEYCRGTISKMPPTPRQCFFGKLGSGTCAKGGDSSRGGKACKYCHGKRQTCYFVKLVDGVRTGCGDRLHGVIPKEGRTWDVSQNPRTRRIAGADVRWVVKKRKLVATDPTDIPFEANGVRV